MFLNRYQLKIFQSTIAFVIGSQLVHLYFNPLKDLNKLVEEKKSILWQDYLRQQKSKDEQVRVDTDGVKS